MMSPLALMKEGETAEIVAHRSKHRHESGHSQGHCGGNCSNCACPDGGSNHKTDHSQDHLIDMGLRPGKFVEMMTNKGTGPLVLCLDECRIALGRGMAMKIYVRRNEH